MSFDSNKYRSSLEGMTKKALTNCLVREAELRHKWEREALGEPSIPKKTRIIKIDVTGQDVDEVTVLMVQRIGALREEGWHFSSVMPVDWLLEDDVCKTYVVCVFCK